MGVLCAGHRVQNRSDRLLACLTTLMAVFIVIQTQGASLPEVLRSANKTGLFEFSPSWLGYLAETTNAGRLIVPASSTNRALFFNAIERHVTKKAATLGERQVPSVASSGRPELRGALRPSSALVKPSVGSGGTAPTLSKPERYEQRLSLPMDATITSATNEWQLLNILGPVYRAGLNSFACSWGPQNESWRLFSLVGEQEVELLYVNATLVKRSNSLEVAGVRVMRGVARPLPVR
jgi:hypothetical protein